MTHTIDTLAGIAAHTHSMDTHAAEEILATYLHQIEEVDQRTIDPDHISDDDAEFLLEAVAQAHRAGDLGAQQLAHLEEVATQVVDAEDTLKALQSQRDKLILEAVGAGARMVDVAQAAELSRGHIYRVVKSHR